MFHTIAFKYLTKNLSRGAWGVRLVELVELVGLAIHKTYENHRKMQLFGPNPQFRSNLGPTLAQIWPKSTLSRIMIMIILMIMVIIMIIMPIIS